jgi:ABC-type multidrug transport system fused ATPase/permease subunit
MHATIFFTMSFFSVLFRQHYIQDGMFASLKLRRILASKMFEKVEKLSMKSLSQCDSGKLVSVISADLSQVERGLGFSPMILGAPAVYVICMILIGANYG